jgi:glucose-6-phosphate 1-dehydrogenase
MEIFGTQAHVAGPSVMVILGAAGDLTKRLLFPSIYNLRKAGLIPDTFAIACMDRTPFTEPDFRTHMVDMLHQFVGTDAEPAIVDWIGQRIYYIQGDFSDPANFTRLAARLTEIDAAVATQGNYFFYLAVSPQFFLLATQQLSTAGLLAESPGRFRRLVIEKPFGRDLVTARQLNHDLMKTVDDSQIYRIDHYLGKETVQNLMAFRFANGIFEPIWNRRYIDHMQITVAETVGVEMRGGFYETAGALRDMVPNHILQLVSLACMEPPISFSAKAIHNEQVKVLDAIHPLSPTDAVRGQYGESEGFTKLAAYREEANVSPTSPMETFVAARLSIDNWRWADVPIYLRTGKRMNKRVTEVSVQFKRAPFALFRNTAVQELPPNVLIMHIQPDEGITLGFEAKVPGPGMNLGTVELKFAYTDYFGKMARTGYETLLYDVMIGDPILFQRADMIEAGWGVISPILDAWQTKTPTVFPNYPAGGWGPHCADELLAKDGRKWRTQE